MKGRSRALFSNPPLLGPGSPGWCRPGLASDRWVPEYANFHSVVVACSVGALHGIVIGNVVDCVAVGRCRCGLCSCSRSSGRCFPLHTPKIRSETVACLWMVVAEMQLACALHAAVLARCGAVCAGVCRW